MPSTYTSNNGIELIGTGEQSGTWGETTNTNFGLIDTALDGQLTKTLASAGTSGSPNTLIIEDGTTSDGRNRLVIFNDGSDLGGTAYVQLTPDNAEKIMFVRNSLSGERSIIFFQGTYNASNDFELPNGTDAVIKFDGAGTGAVVEAVFKKLYLQDLLLDTSSAQTMYIESTIPTFNMKETDADLNEKFWRLQTSAGVFKVDAVNDAYDTAATAYSVDRTGVTPNLHIWYSNASEAMRVTSAGNVGIGTSTPSTTLDVNGTITGTTGNITTVNATTVDTTNIEATNIKAKDGTASATIADATGVMTVASSVLTTTDINGGTIDGVTIGGASAGAGTFTSVTGTSLDINGNAVFNESGADVDFRIESDTNTHAFFLQGSNGNVGIGTSSPQALLDVTDATGNQLVVGTNTNASGTEAGILFKHDTDNNNREGGGIRSVRNGSTTDFGLALDVGINSVSTEALFISGADASPGYVGIGTSSPSEKLHISGTGETILVTPVAFSTNQDSPYLIASGTNYNGATTNWSTYGYQHRLKTNAAGTPRVTIDTNLGEAYSVNHQSVICPNGVTLGTAAGTYNAANTLDDYEEGTWTPVLSDGTTDATTTRSTGVYTKVGNSVFATVYLRQIDTTGLNAVSQIRITLPFTSIVGTNQPSFVGSCDLASITLTGSPHVLLDFGDAYCKLRQNNPVDFVAVEDLTSGSAIIKFTIQYIAA